MSADTCSSSGCGDFLAFTFTRYLLLLWGRYPQTLIVLDSEKFVEIEDIIVAGVTLGQDCLIDHVDIQWVFGRCQVLLLKFHI